MKGSFPARKEGQAMKGSRSVTILEKPPKDESENEDSISMTDFRNFPEYDVPRFRQLRQSVIKHINNLPFEQLSLRRPMPTRTSPRFSMVSTRTGDWMTDKADRYSLAMLAEHRPSGDFLRVLAFHRFHAKPGPCKTLVSTSEYDEVSPVGSDDWTSEIKKEALEMILEENGIGAYKAALNVRFPKAYSRMKVLHGDDELREKALVEDLSKEDGHLKTFLQFCTGSSYAGQCHGSRMHGVGEFSSFSGSCYVGGMGDGMFFGQGDLYFPNGSHVKGQWVRGKLIGGHYVFGDGLAIRNKNWRYCMGSNRRYQEELVHGLRPAGRSLITNKAPPRKIPPGCYDTGDGFYVRSKGIVVSATTGEFIRVPSAEEQTWIVKNCRKSWDEYLKHRALYGKKLY